MVRLAKKIREREEAVVEVEPERRPFLPRCICCGSSWNVVGGVIRPPSCGCGIHGPLCPRCGYCALHCEHRSR